MPDLPEAWIISVGGRAYGPYSAGQMRDFAREGRLVAMSQVARAGETDFRNALDDPALARLFVPTKPVSQPAGEPVQSPDIDRSASFGKLETGAADEPVSAISHFIIIADMKSRSIQGLEEEIHRLGSAYPVLPQTWILNTEATISAVRNLLIQQLGKLDTLLVVDASRDKAAWFNFPPEKESRLRRMWTKQSDSRARA